MSAVQVRCASSPGDVDYLAALLLNHERPCPVVVVTSPFDAAEPWIDVEMILADVGDLADVWLLPDRQASWRLADLLPPDTQVYGGAGRVYPVGTLWQLNPYKAPLRLVTTPDEGIRQTEVLISDALNMAVDAGLLSPKSGSVAKPVRYEGTVIGAVGTRGLVKLDNGQQAAIWRELTVPGVELECLIQQDQRVTGLLDPATRRFDVRAALVSAETALASYNVGDVIPARVSQIGSDWITVDLFPGTNLRLPASSVTDDEAEDLTDIFTVGEVVRARITSLAPLAVRLDDVSPYDETEPAPALLPGGPPWLVAPRPLRRPPMLGVTPVVSVKLPPGPPSPLHLAARAGGGVRHPHTAEAIHKPDAEIKSGAAAAGSKVVGAGPGQTPAPDSARKAGSTPVPPQPPVPKPRPGPRPDAGAPAAAAAPTQGPASAAAPTPPPTLASPSAPGATAATSYPTPTAGQTPAVDAAAATTSSPTPAQAAAPPKPSPRPGPKPGPRQPHPITGPPAAPGHGAVPAPITPTKSAPTYAELENLLAIAENRARVAQDKADEWRRNTEFFPREIDGLRRQISELAATNNELTITLTDLRTQLRDARDANRTLRRERGATSDNKTNAREELILGQFSDPEQQLRWEIYVAWVCRFGPPDKINYPLPDEYDIGPNFIASMESLQGVDRGKVVDVIVEVLTGISEKKAGRKQHQLRGSGGGGTPSRSRPDGATGWRVAIQQGTPGARALHFWRQTNKVIELDQVGLHDDALL